MIDVERLRQACERERWSFRTLADRYTINAPKVEVCGSNDGYVLGAAGPLRLVCRMLAVLAECEVDDG